MNDQLKYILQVVSYLCGWVYVASWSLSFYPQPLLNWRRRSTQGITVDYPFLNLIGFSCYTLSTAIFLYSPTIRSQYAERHPRAPHPTVRFNDFAFGAHALILCSLTYSQFYHKLWGFDVSKTQRISRPAIVVAALCAASLLLVITIVLVQNGPFNQKATRWAWIDVVYFVGHVKLVATLVKYAPQAVLNYRRKSTRGWSIDQVLLDILGSVLSLAQLIIDAGMQDDWSGIWGNPIKLGLGNISMLYDLVFIVQHYVLYTDRSEPGPDEDDERDPLLSPR